MKKEKRADGEPEILNPELPSKDQIVDLTTKVKVETTDLAPHHKGGEVIECSPIVADKMVINGWGKILTAIAFLLVSTFALAQGPNRFINPLKAGPTGPPIYADTVTNTATAYLTSPVQLGKGVNATTTVGVTATKISGTVAGTISLLGSTDGVNYKAMTIAEASTALTTYTATDVASQTFHWRLTGSPFLYYRVSWTGAGTMSASFIANLVSK